MLDLENAARNLIERIAKEVGPDATRKRIKRSIQLVLESFAPDHVFTELLQNADDVEATVAEIRVTNKGMFFIHNGVEFDEPHLRALCDIGETTKKPGVNIGFMGIGFKAVFKISGTPHVFSGPYKFYFTREEVIVPHWLDNLSADIQTHLQRGFTTFFLPFREDLTPEIIKSLEETVLMKLEPLCLVFLKNIMKIVITSESGTRALVRTKEIRSNDFTDKKEVSVIEKKGDKEREYNFLVFNRILEILEYAKNDYRARESRRAELNATNVTLVFTLKDGLIEPAKSVLYTFLPTPFETGLRFAVNCDFLLNTQRTEIDFVSKWNLWLLESVSIVLREAVHEFLRDEKQKLCFYDVLPRKREVSEKLFAKVGTPLIDYMKDHPLILTGKGGLAKPSEVVLASEEVQDIIPPEKAGAKYYVNARIQGKIFLREELGIRDLEGTEEREYMLKELKDETWLSSLDARQARAIYEFLCRRLYGSEEEQWKLTWGEHSQLEANLKDMRIVRSADGHYHKGQETILPIVAGKESNELASLPCLFFVDPEVLSDTSLKLLRKLGLSDYSAESIVRRILDVQGKGEWEGWTEEERLKSISYVAKWFVNTDYQIQREMKNKLGDLALPIEGGGWAIASDCYVPSSELKEILPDANYVDLAKIEAQVTDVNRFLNAMAILDLPRVLPLGERKQFGDNPAELSRKSWESYWSWLDREGHRTYQGRDYRIRTRYLDGFGKCVVSQNEDKLTGYLSFLLTHWDDYYKSYENSSYRWSYYGENNKDVPSYFAYQLKTSKWLPTSKGLATSSEAFAPLREIKRVAGNLVSYLRIPEEQARQKKEFIHFLGIETEISLRMLLSILSMARDAEINDSLKAQLGRIYARIATLCEDEKVDEETYILDRKGGFQSAKNLYWLDDPETESVFGEEVPAAWVPDGVSRPHIEALFSAVGVTSISSVLERKRANDKQEVVEDVGSTNELRRRKDYLYSVLLHHKAERVEEFPDFITKVIVTKVNQLEIELGALGKVHEIEVPCFCSREERRIYISHNMQPTDVARELVRVFKAPLGSEFTLGFVLTQQHDTILEQLKRSSIQLVRVPESTETEVTPEKEAEIPEQQPERVPTQAIESIAHELLERLGEETPMTPPPTPSAQEPAKTLPPEVSVDFDNVELAKEIEEAKQLLTGGKSPATRIGDVWREPMEIDKVIAEARVVVRPFVSASSKKNWEPRTLDGEKVFIETGMDLSRIEAQRSSIKTFRDRMRKIVEIMGGNPETVNVCIVNRETDGDRREGQLFFNVLRNDKPLRWIVIAARELAYIRFPKPSQAHISLMADLIEKALERIQEIYPEILNKENTV